MAEHTIIALLHDRPGALHRTVTLLRRRGFNIISLAVGRAEQPDLSRCTLVVDVDDATQVVRQLDRLVDVLGAADVTASDIVEREAALLKLRVPAAHVSELRTLVTRVGARIEAHVIASDDHFDVIVGLTDAPARIDALVTALVPLGLVECCRTGRLAMLRGPMPRELAPPTDYRAQADGAPTEEAA